MIFIIPAFLLSIPFLQTLLYVIHLLNLLALFQIQSLFSLLLHEYMCMCVFLSIICSDCTVLHSKIIFKIPNHYFKSSIMILFIFANLIFTSFFSFFLSFFVNSGKQKLCICFLKATVNLSSSSRH